VSDEGERLPLFPLSTVLFPGAVLPLHIFEPRYRDLVRDLSEAPAGSRAFGVVAIRHGREVGVDGIRALYDVGTMAVVRGIDPYPDGRFDIVTVGAARFRLRTLLEGGTAYLTAVVDVLDLDDHPMVDDTVAARRAATVRRSFDAYRRALGLGADEPLADDPELLSWQVAEGLVVGTDEAQRMLAASDTVSRLRVQSDILRRELALFRELPSLPALDLARAPMPLN
jgi:hypothetical protein